MDSSEAPRARGEYTAASSPTCSITSSTKPRGWRRGLTDAAVAASSLTVPAQQCDRVAATSRHQTGRTAVAPAAPRSKPLTDGCQARDRRDHSVLGRRGRPLPRRQLSHLRRQRQYRTNSQGNRHELQHLAGQNVPLLRLTPHPPAAHASRWSTACSRRAGGQRQTCPCMPLQGRRRGVASVRPKVRCESSKHARLCAPDRLPCPPTAAHPPARRRSSSRMACESWVSLRPSAPGSRP